MRKNQTYDLFVGLDPLNALSAIILRKIGRVDVSVYYTIDYVPQRYKNHLINFFYHALDKFCVANCDETWNDSFAMVKARAAFNGMKGEKYARQKELPIGVWFDEIERVPINRVNKKKLVYVGGLRYIMGVELLIRSMPKLLEMDPKLRLEIIGGGVDEEKLKQLAKKLNVNNTITFYGWVRDRKRVKDLLKDGLLGFAPFVMDKYSTEVKNADPTKVKEYLAVGMPVIMTKSVNYHKDIERAGCGVAINYSVSGLVNAVHKIIKNEKRYISYREKALAYMKQFDYNILFGNALERVLL